jgi:hypothetical protein
MDDERDRLMTTDNEWDGDYLYRSIEPEIMTPLLDQLFGNNETVSEEALLAFFNGFIPIFRDRNSYNRNYHNFYLENFESSEPITRDIARDLIMYNINGGGLRREFRDLHMETERRIQYANGDVFEGILWTNNTRRYGTMTYADGRVYEGMWENDNPILGQMNTTTTPSHLIGGLQVLAAIENIPASSFLASQYTFIIVNSLGSQHRHIGIDMTTVIKTIYVGCNDDTPSLTEVLKTGGYPSFVKEETRDNLYMKMPINDGVLIMVQLPIILTGTRFFKMVQIGTIFKFMDIDLAKGRHVELAGADHCNQTEPQKVYSLVELEVEELTKIIATTKAQAHLQEKEQADMATREAEIIAERGPTIKIRYNNREVIIPYSTPPAETTIGWVKEQFRRDMGIPPNIRVEFVYLGRKLADDVFISALRDYARAVLLALVSFPLPPAPPDEEGDAKGFNKHRKSKKHNRKSKKHRNLRKTRTKRHYKRFKTMRK